MGRPRRLSHNVSRVWRQIENLTLNEMLDLSKLILEATKHGPDNEGGAGVREPRKPLKPLIGDAVSAEKPQDVIELDIQGKTDV